MGQFRLLAWTGLSVITVAAAWHNIPRLSPGMLDWAEPGNVAAALVQGRGFSDPFDGGTGATAWVAPLPAWIEAAVFLVLGTKSVASAKAMLVLSVLGLSVAHAIVISSLALWGSWARRAASAAFLAYCAFLPGSPLTVLSEAWLDIPLSAGLLWAALETRRSPARRGPAALGAVALLAPLENAGIALATGLVIVVLAWSFRKNIRRAAGPAIAAAAAALTLGCWTLRNEVVLGRPVPLKSNFWFELHLANVDAADGLPRMETVLRALPFFDVAQFRRYSLLGEMAYVDSFRAPAAAALRRDPPHFAANVVRRLAAATVFCRREGGGTYTVFPFRPEDAARLAAAGELIVVNPSRALWTRIDATPGEALALIRTLGLRDEAAILRDWAARRLAFDREFRGPGALALGFLTAGLPVLALLIAAMLGGGTLPPPAFWAAVIAAGMLLPFVLVNHNERHQLALIALQAVALGTCAQAITDRAGRRTPSP